MDQHLEVERSKALLKRQLLPRVQLRVRRQLLARRAKEKLDTAARPDAQILRLSPLLAGWPDAALEAVLAASRLEYRSAGMVAALAGEPCATLVAYWVVSGKLTQVPTKQEVLRCAVDALGPSPGAAKVAVTAPLVFPTLFRSQGVGAGGAAGADTRLTPQQEAVLDDLASYSAAQLVDGDAFFLGDGRRRTLRCQSDAVLLAMPLDLLLRELASLQRATRHACLSVARDAVTARLAKSAQRPQVGILFEKNALLQGLSTRALREVATQLRPLVFLTGETICRDTFTSDTVYFLGRGVVCVATEHAESGGTDGRCGYRHLERRHAVGIALHSFAPHQLPVRFGERRCATAHGYCEVWAVSVQALVAACDATDELSCARLAMKMLMPALAGAGGGPGGSRWGRLTGINVAAALMQVPAFLSLTEESLQAMARTMRLRVHTPGKVILASAHAVKEGLLLLSGRCRVTPGGGTGRRVAREGRAGGATAAAAPLRPGIAAYFCEALLARPASVRVEAETGVVALHASAGAMMDALESLSEFDLHSVIDAANAYVVHVYGAGSGLHEATPPERAAARVREHNAREKREAKEAAAEAAAEVMGRALHDRSGAQTRAEVMALTEKIAENGILTSLALQLQSLHYDEVAAQRQRLFHDATGSTINRCAHDAERAAALAQDRRRASAQRPTGCFTLDESGALLFAPNRSPRSTSTSGDKSETWSTASPSPAPPPPRGEEQLASGPRSSATAMPTAPMRRVPATAAALAHASPRAVCASPVPPPLSLQAPTHREPPSVRAERAASHRSPSSHLRDVPSHSLHAPFAPSRHTHHRTTVEQTTRSAADRPPRLAALRHAAEHLKNEADGWNEQRELRRVVERRLRRR